jgi:hypothetical protein
MKAKDQTITCPECGKVFPLTTAITNSIEQRLRAEMEKDIKAKEKEIEARAKKANEALNEREQELSKKKQEIEALEKNIDIQVDAKLQSSLKKERQKVEDQLRKKISEDNTVVMEDLQRQLAEKTEKVDEASRMELAFRKQLRDLEQAKKDMELNVQRRLDEERKTIAQEVAGRVQEEHKLKLADKEKVIADLHKTIDELKQKSEQGSQQTQGEVLEEDIENILSTVFVKDIIEPVAPGKRGADVLQKINANVGPCCGTILWECKRTKNWSDAWISKLIEDQREAKADLAVLVTMVLPDDVKDFDVRDGVIITRPAYVVPLAQILRGNVFEVSRAKRSMEGKSEKKEMLYQFLTSNEFSQALKAVVESLKSAHDALESEKKSMARIWKKREFQIKRAMYGLIDIYGPISGIVGASLPEIAEFELELEGEKGGPKKISQLISPSESDKETGEDKEEDEIDK